MKKQTKDTRPTQPTMLDARQLAAVIGGSGITGDSKTIVGGFKSA